MRYAIFGDVGGHAAPFMNALQTLDVDLLTQTMPDDLTIVQVGDLIHKGAQTNDLVAFVDQMLYKYPDRWVQLMGNHESQHVGGHTFWRCDCSLETAKTLQRWFITGAMRVSFAIPSAHSSYFTNDLPTLITHAGLSHKMWRKLGSKVDVNELNAYIHKLVQSPGGFNLLNQTGIMLDFGGLPPKAQNPGPWWAAASQEVYPTWLDIDMPFNQIHGHTAPYMWDHQEWFPHTPWTVKRNHVLFDENRAMRYAASALTESHASGDFLAVDPGFEISPPQIDIMPFVSLNV